jgi:hypothetical protein
MSENQTAAGRLLETIYGPSKHKHFIHLVNPSRHKDFAQIGTEQKNDVDNLYRHLERNGIVKCTVEDFQEHFGEKKIPDNRIEWRSTATSLVYFLKCLNVFGIFPDADYRNLSAIVRRNFTLRGDKEFDPNVIKSIKSRLSSSYPTKDEFIDGKTSPENQVIRDIVDDVFA